VAGLPKLEIKKILPNRRLFHVEKVSSFFHLIVLLKQSGATKYLRGIIRVITEISYKDSLKIFDLSLKTLDNSVNRI
jgi:hypothetical protein